MLFSLLVPFLSLSTTHVSARSSSHSSSSSSSSKRHPHPHNPSHPHRSLLKRSITNDPSIVNGNSFDFIVAGGGLSGLAVAARLSEWSNVTVLVVEAGGDGNDVQDQIDIPGYSYLHSLTGSAYDWAYSTVPQDDALGTTKYWPRGKGLGGSGAVNGMYWCRPGKEDFDAWAALNPGADQTWNWDQVNKYINKAETFQQPPQSIQDDFTMVLNASAHGTDGPIKAGFSQFMYDTVKLWIPTWVNMGFKNFDIAQGSTHGVSLVPTTLNQANQTRSDSKAGYIDPLPPRSNLVILTGQQVTQIIFSGTKDSNGNAVASGIKFQASAGTTTYTAQANKEVILSGGTVGSPQMLQLSGVGPNDILQNLGIQTVIDLPVGYNLQDHVSYSMYWSTAPGTETWSNLANSPDMQASALAEYRSNHTGKWTFINQAIGYPSMTDLTSDTEASSYADEVKSAMSDTLSQMTSWHNLPANVASGLADQYAIQQQWLTNEVGQHEILLTMLGNNGNLNEIGIQVAYQHPWSRGTIFINSSDPFVKPIIDPAYFGVGYDIDIMNMGSEFARKLAAAAPLNTVLINETSPGPTITGDGLSNFTKQHAGTEYHPIGTCSMIPKDKGGVVDTNLVVYGTANVRVIDCSVMPLHISAHTMTSGYGIAEKGADIIKLKYFATNNDGASETTASVGKATDTAVTGGANGGGGSSSSALSLGAKIGIGAGAGAAALAILGGLIIVCCMKRKRNTQADNKVFYHPSSTFDRDVDAGLYKEAGYGTGGSGFTDTNPSYPMSDYGGNGGDESGGYGGYGEYPHPNGGHTRNQSLSSMGTVEMASRTPMGPNSGDYGHGAPQQYYDQSPPRPGENQASWDQYPREQHYHSVRL